MYKFYCSSCGKRNSFASKNQEPNFCSHCGHPRNGVASSNQADESEEMEDHASADTKDKAIQEGKDLAKNILRSNTLSFSSESND